MQLLPYIFHFILLCGLIAGVTYSAIWYQNALHAMSQWQITHANSVQALNQISNLSIDQTPALFSDWMGDGPTTQALSHINMDHYQALRGLTQDLIYAKYALVLSATLLALHLAYFACKFCARHLKKKPLQTQATAFKTSRNLFIIMLLGLSASIVPFALKLASLQHQVDSTAAVLNSIVDPSLNTIEHLQPSTLGTQAQSIWDNSSDASSLFNNTYDAASSKAQTVMNNINTTQANIASMQAPSQSMIDAIDAKFHAHQMAQQALYHQILIIAVLSILVLATLIAVHQTHKAHKQAENSAKNELTVGSADLQLSPPPNQAHIQPPPIQPNMSAARPAKEPPPPIRTAPSPNQARVQLSRMRNGHT